ncbi:hypothetical protein M407DRAFT_25011 [Tulasnella calospora MUT 4182]|uniref:Uncharacterized protein n=1 Tax=Tulasnella calospora MUT 4182 TaxID=1051891 RepID=A0A0C3QI93_9AGAM|nr:hypothetical protein M407DRAFT_25011 [Tulasnella calospora MUT 4182]
MKYSISYFDGNKQRVLPKGTSETMWLGRPGIPKGLKAGLFHLKEGQSGTWTCNAEDGFERDIDLEDHGKKFKIPAKTQLDFEVDLESVIVGAASN